jgi:hypothetical protein
MSRLALGHIRARVQGTSFTTPCKSELAAAAVPDDPSRIERGSAQGFPLAKISASGFLNQFPLFAPPFRAGLAASLFARRRHTNAAIGR